MIGVYVQAVNFEAMTLDIDIWLVNLDTKQVTLSSECRSSEFMVTG